MTTAGAFVFGLLIGVVVVITIGSVYSYISDRQEKAREELDQIKKNIQYLTEILAREEYKKGK